MIWVKIKADLERELRKSTDPTCVKVVAAVEEEKAKLAAKQEKDREAGQVTWVWIIQEFRKHLGSDLALPPSPSGDWIRTQVVRTRRLGLNEQQIYELCAGAARVLRRRPIDLEYLLRRAPEFLSAYDRYVADHGGVGAIGDRGGGDAGDGLTAGEPGHSRVFTGRPASGA